MSGGGTAKPIIGRVRGADAVSRYVLEERLGAGGEGVVFGGHDPELGRRVAIKLFRSADGGREARSKSYKRLAREAKALGQLSHPNVVPVFDVGEYDWNDLEAGARIDEVPLRGVFVVMENVRGVTLKEWLAKGTRSRAEIVEMFLGAGRGLAHAHERGLIHRDFKPSNVLVDTEGRARLLDFGLARAAQDLSLPSDELVSSENDATGSAVEERLESLTAPGSIVGTPRYMAPEQAVGGQVDARADQFAFCLALLESVAGTRLTSGVVWRLRFGRHASLPGPPEVPRALHAILRRGLSLDPDDRYPSMPALINALQSWDRPKKRRRTLLVAGLGAALAVASLVGPPSNSYSHCVDEQPISQVWSPLHRQNAQRTYVGSGATDAGSVWAAAADNLDAYAENWSRERELACDAGRQPTGSSTRVDKKFECLEDRRRRFSALVGAFSEADRESLDKVVIASAGLPPLSACSDEAYLRGTVAPPEDPVVAHRVERIRELLARAGALNQAGDAERATLRADEALAMARLLEYDPVTIEAELMKAEAQAAAGDADGAVETLEAAYARGVAAGLDVLASQASVGLLHAALDLSQNDSRTQRWQKHTTAQLGRSSPSAELSAHLEVAAGRIDQNAGDYGSAIEHYRKAEELFRQWWGGGNARSAVCMVNIGSALLSQMQWDEALDYFEQAEPMLSAAYGLGHPYVIMLQINIGGAYLGQRRVDESIAMLDRAVAGFDVGASERNMLAGQAHAALGDALIQAGRTEEAATHLLWAQSAVVATSGPEHPLVGFVLNSRASVAAVEGDLEEAVLLGRQAVECLETAFGPDDMRSLPALANLGSALRLSGRSREACEVLERTLQGYAPGGKFEHRRTAIVALHLGAALIDDGNVREGLAVIRDAEEALPRLAPGDAVMGRVFFERGRAALIADDPRAALDLLRQSLEWAQTDPLRESDAHEAKFEIAKALWAMGRHRAAHTGARQLFDELEEEAESDLRGAVSEWLQGHRRPRNG